MTIHTQPKSSRQSLVAPEPANYCIHATPVSGAGFNKSPVTRLVLANRVSYCIVFVIPATEEKQHGYERGYATLGRI